MEPHNGEEFGYVAEGTVNLVCDNKKYELKKGETFYLLGKSFHYLCNKI